VSLVGFETQFDLTWIADLPLLWRTRSVSSIPLGKSGQAIPLCLFHLCSILWIAWDPYWLRRLHSQGAIKVQGRAIWVVSRSTRLGNYH
jgi:hypothetical protein